MSYIIPVGPYHPALEEPVHARLYTEGELIKDAEVFVGYNHRGIEKLATERNAIQTLVLVERVCGICSHSHAFTYALAVEDLNGIEVPKRGEYLRVITAELERLHSHFLWLGIACHIIGHDSMFMHIWDERELIMDILEKLSGNRVNYAMVTIGGARRDIDDDFRREILDACEKLKGPMDRIVDIALNDKTIALRTKGVGVLTREDAIRLGAIGPHARASGVDIDVRRDSPYSSYNDFEFNVPVVDSGDVFGLEGAKTNELDLVALNECFGNCFESSVDCLLPVFFGKTGFCCNSSDEFRFVHSFLLNCFRPKPL